MTEHAPEPDTETETGPDPLELVALADQYDAAAALPSPYKPEVPGDVVVQDTGEDA